MNELTPDEQGMLVDAIHDSATVIHKGRRMNKEFKKLLEASYTKGFEECARTGHKVGQLDAIFNSIVMGEFAELIVAECMRMCEVTEMSFVTHDCDVEASGAITVKQFIAEHFEVEE